MIKKKGTNLAIRNDEVRRSIDDVVELIKTYPRENEGVLVDENDCRLFRRHYSKLMYKSVLSSTRLSFGALKKRLASKRSTGIFFMERPFFDVDVELKVPNVSMNPSLEEIQNAINMTAKAILACSKELTAWGMGDDGPENYYDMITQDKEIVKVIILLTGSRYINLLIQALH